MPNYNYNAGRSTEYTVRKRLLKAGMVMVMRTAGSHGAYDLIGIHRSGRVHFVQVKRTKDKAQALRLIKQFKQDPPLSDGEYTQSMVVYVTKTREYLEAQI